MAVPFHDAGRNLADAVRVAVADVLSEIAVNVDVDQSGRDVRPGGVDDLRACGHGVVVHKADDAVVIRDRLAGENPVLEDQPAVFDEFHTFSLPLCFTDVNIFCLKGKPRTRAGRKTPSRGNAFAKRMQTPAQS